jgi:transposase
LIRNIKFLLALPDAETRTYANNLLTALKAMFGVIHRRQSMSGAAFRQALEEAKSSILSIGIEDAPSQLDSDGNERKKEAQNMARRFREHGEAYFTFITTPGVEPTNNLAEQAIRFIVIQRTVAQGTRSENGRTAAERLWTVAATCQQQGRSAFQFILESVRASFYNQPPPSLLPNTPSALESLPP